ncbi:MAG: hypothetical protein QM597_00980 [Aeromicrobium sp.]|uniref:hypothetical protein n=1 Tax=Aeromicrobium sp. TaxID=1871063 RepID=UPI0039E5C73C
MSQLQGIAGRLRALAHDATPLSANVTSAARELTGLARQAEAIGRTGVNVGPLISAVQTAAAQASAAADAAAQVKADGVAWADHLARSGGGGGSSAEGSRSRPTAEKAQKKLSLQEKIRAARTVGPMIAKALVSPEVFVKGTLPLVSGALGIGTEVAGIDDHGIGELVDKGATAIADSIDAGAPQGGSAWSTLNVHRLLNRIQHGKK